MKVFKKKLKDNQSGTVLLLALVVMSGLVVTGVALGDIIINEIRQSRQLDKAIVSYYAAESAAEKIIFDWRDTGLLPLPCNETSEIGWTCSKAIGSVNQLDFSLPKMATQEIILYNPLDLNEPSNVESARIIWQDANTGNVLEPWLEVTIMEWTRGISIDWDDAERRIIKKVFKCSAEVATPAVCDTIALEDEFSANKSYIIRLRALHDDTENIVVRFYESPAATGIKELNSYIKSVNLTGIYGGVEQGINVRFPVVGPSSPLFDFVLFSEESLLKTVE